MFELMYGAALIGGFCLLCGVIYPIGAAIVYPFYRWRGGKQSFIEYMKSL